ncbi:nuclear transport factor 2 family protein [Ideonella sp. 4Y16]|uniref:YybH family protein n=1 Tax=Ideonella alba TaxID=2824118 RepID=UPI001B37C8E0|nr:nuclear transport factor 2 family protein [Ideonella alba]MBQ0945778.1 nuclear transport factor 2 family protein [Ideonella alba]
MSPLRRLFDPALWLLAALPAGVAAAPDLAALREEVRGAEAAFADSMARRDLAAFAGFVADDAVFLNGGQPLRGKDAVLAHWQRFFDGPRAPFAWRPELVEVIGSGGLAQSTGPVTDPAGTLVARFYSTWRREADGRWRVVLDNGYDVSPDGCAKP